MHPNSALLRKAILAGPREAERYWRRWRAETDVATMPEECVRLIPMLGPPEAWLADDAAKNMILGIRKRAWTRNQLMLRLLAEAVGVLEAEGVREALVAGPAALAMAHQAARRVRAVNFLELAVPRAQAMQAASALGKAGWRALPKSIAPEGEALDYVAGIWMEREAGERLRLSWRLLPAPPEFAADWESLTPGERVEFQGVKLALPAKEVLLASAMAGDDPDWRFDGAMLLRGPAMDWSAVGRSIRFAPEARRKLATLARETGLRVPRSVLKDPEANRLRAQWDFLMRDYRLATRSGRQTSSLRGFLGFLCDRWQARAWQLPFFGLFYMMRYTFPGRSGGGQ